MQKRCISIRRMIESRTHVKLEEKDIDEKFIRGSGPGGQAVNTTSNCVQLLHRPTGATVKCHKTRYLEINRKEARKILLEKVDDIVNPTCSLRLIKLEKARQRNHVQRRKAEKKKEEKELLLKLTLQDENCCNAEE